ncbi:hypothetical protein ABIB62_004337 [Mucilaginibacter sp. UYP25]
MNNSYILTYRRGRLTHNYISPTHHKPDSSV